MAEFHFHAVAISLSKPSDVALQLSENINFFLEILFHIHFNQADTLNDVIRPQRKANNKTDAGLETLR